MVTYHYYGIYGGSFFIEGVIQAEAVKDEQGLEMLKIALAKKHRISEGSDVIRLESLTKI